MRRPRMALLQIFSAKLLSLNCSVDFLSCGGPIETSQPQKQHDVDSGFRTPRECYPCGNHEHSERSALKILLQE
jgi:hypothetical protein